MTPPDAHPAPEIRLLEGAFYAGDPHPAFDWMRRHAPLYRDPRAGSGGAPATPT